jgi:hypothetical protein
MPTASAPVTVCVRICVSVCLRVCADAGQAQVPRRALLKASCIQICPFLRWLASATSTP